MSQNFIYKKKTFNKTYFNIRNEEAFKKLINPSIKLKFKISLASKICITIFYETPCICIIRKLSQFTYDLVINFVQWFYFKLCSFSGQY